MQPLVRCAAAAVLVGIVAASAADDCEGRVVGWMTQRQGDPGSLRKQTAQVD